MIKEKQFPVKWEK